MRTLPQKKGSDFAKTRLGHMAHGPARSWKTTLLTDRIRNKAGPLNCWIATNCGVPSPRIWASRGEDRLNDINVSPMSPRVHHPGRRHCCRRSHRALYRSRIAAPRTMDTTSKSMCAVSSLPACSEIQRSSMPRRKEGRLSILPGCPIPMRSPPSRRMVNTDRETFEQSVQTILRRLTAMREGVSLTSFIQR